MARTDLVTPYKKPLNSEHAPIWDVRTVIEGSLNFGGEKEKEAAMTEFFGAIASFIWKLQKDRDRLLSANLRAIESLKELKRDLDTLRRMAGTPA